MRTEDIRTHMSDWEILSKIPDKDNGNFDRAFQYDKCQYYECNSACTSRTIGYCSKHFVQLYKEYKVEIPTLKDMENYIHEMNTTEDSFRLLKQKYGTTMESGTGICHERSRENRCSKHFVLNLNHSQDDLIQSEAPTTLPKSSKKKPKRSRCIGPTCSGFGDERLNGLCEKCHDTLLRCRSNTAIKSGKLEYNGSGVTSLDTSTGHVNTNQYLSDLDLRLPDDLQSLNLSNDSRIHISESRAEVVSEFRSSYVDSYVNDDKFESDKTIDEISSTKVDLVVVPCETHYIKPTRHRKKEHSVVDGNISQFRHFQSEYTPMYDPNEHMKRNSFNRYYSGSERKQGIPQEVYPTRNHPSSHLVHPQSSSNTVSTRTKRQSCMLNQTNSQTNFDFIQVAQKIEENSRRELSKCLKHGCCNYGNSKCQGYCNSCNKLLVR